MTGTFDRRAVLGMLGIGSASVVPWSARSSSASHFSADDGSPVRTLHLGERQVALAFGLAVRIGPPDAEAVLYELFDYNCGYCRSAGPALDSVLREEPRLALRLVHCPVLSAASMEAACVQQGAVLTYGAQRAYDLHLAVMASHGPMNGARVRMIGAQMGLGDIRSDLVERATTEVAEMRRGAAGLGLRITPTFVLGETAFIGWPGPLTLRSTIEANRRCGRLQCG